MNIICVGDNVVDCYLDQRMYYPGGNAVNVAVGCRRNGADPVSYLGVFGDDPEAGHIQRCLDAEGVDWSRSRRVYAASGHPAVSLDPEGDRIFVGGPKDTAQHILRLRLTPPDLEWIGQFQVCHSSCYSGIEPELGAIASRTELSFDFSTRSDEEYIRAVAPALRFAFFSGAALTEERLDSIIGLCHACGVEIVGMTLGSRGALFSREGRRFVQPVKPAERVVDTMGAGDSFIAGFLTRFCDAGDMVSALDFAAERAAFACGYHGGFGYPHPFEA